MPQSFVQMSAIITHIEKKKSLAPKLRFKGFDLSYKKIPLGSICSDITYGLTVRPSFVEVGIPLLSAREISKGVVDYESAPKISEKDFNALSEKAKPKFGDLFVSKTGSIGFSALVTKNIVAAISQNIAIIRVSDNKKFSQSFILQYFKTEIFLKAALARVNKSTIMDLQLQDIRKLVVPLITLPEQQKIASFLSAVDEKIHQLTRKKELLEQYKKGVMQQLFSGKLRFKDESGKAFPNWEEKLYGDVYSFYSTNSFSRDNLNYESGKVKNIHYGDIHTKFSSRFEVNEEAVPYISPTVDLSKVKEENYCQEGDLVIADASEDYIDIGKTIELIKLNKEKVLAGLHTFLARPNKTKMHVGFSGYLVQASYVRKQVMTIAQGTKVLSLSTGRLSEVKLEIPCLEEQKKIADYLFNIDNKIESVSKQITQTQTFKKGLLQQMFV